ncbi:MAG: isopenicillin N synthase family oxygenase [Xanthomonadales bacterium]|nr:isopenicillin N synthase family oxygenase [Xanthomonadales bacterium]
MSNRKQRGIGAVNQEFRRYEQVRKDQNYHLAEKTGTEQFDDDYRIQSCDMRLFFDGGEQGKLEFARQLGKALADIGFAILTGHGIGQDLYRQCSRHVVALFEDTTAAERKAYLASRHGSVNQGYFPKRETTIIHPDLVEGWVFCRRAFDLDGHADFSESKFWPRPGFEAQFRELVLAQQQLILPVMQSLLRYLGCETHCFDDKLEATNFGFRLNYYPPMDDSERSSGAGRMLGHEDVDLFTFLPAPEVEGLQVLNRQNMKWIRLNAPPGSIILNTGDYMQRISNDIFPSTTHRVSPPADPALLGKPRVSMPMAIYLWEDEILEVLPGTGEPKYPPISAIEFHTAITSKYYGDDYAVKNPK